MDRVPESLNRRFYEQQRLLTLDDPPYPDSLYAVSKLFGENLGRYLVTTANIQFVGLRIGWLVPEDDASIKKGTLSEDYLRAMFSANATVSKPLPGPSRSTHRTCGPTRSAAMIVACSTWRLRRKPSDFIRRTMRSHSSRMIETGKGRGNG